MCTAPQGFLWRLERETLVILCIIFLVVFFAITGFITSRYHATEAALGGHWYEKGAKALKAHQPVKAVDAFHTALIYSRDNGIYQLQLAEALVESDRLNEAEAYLRALWVREPGNGTVNLELARLAARRSDVASATRYYHNAIYGVWDSNPIVHRRETRMELCEFLLAKNERTLAESELIALSADMPPDAALHAKVGRMFLQVRDYPHALQQFQQALKLKPSVKGAWAGAGEAAYESANYAEAYRYLKRAVVASSSDLQSAQRLEMCKLILSLDPFGRRLSQSERIRRTLAAFKQALARVNQCAQNLGVNLQSKQSNTALGDIYASAKKMQPKVNKRSLRRDPDLISKAMDLVFQMEQTAERACGIPPDPDRALLMIAHTRGATER